MDEAQERQERVQALVQEIRDGQAAMGSPSPFVPFLNLVTQFIVDTEMRLDKIEALLSQSDDAASKGKDILPIIHT